MKLVLMQPQLRAFDDTFNTDAISAALAPLAGALDREDIVLLPEHFHFSGDPEGYLGCIRGIAADMRCHIVGGSYHETQSGRRVNAGVVMTPEGEVLARYEKLRPYADERRWVEPGIDHGCVMIGEWRVLVRICADFWFSDLFLGATELPDLVLVPALSVTRKPTPDYSQGLWRNLAVSRAYEFGLYAGISDWGHPSELPKLITSGVGGFADPTGLDSHAFYTPIGESVRVYTPDREALEAFRTDRRIRGFFWK